MKTDRLTTKIKELATENEILRGKALLEQHAAKIGIILTMHGYKLDGKHYRIENWDAVYRETCRRHSHGETGRFIDSMLKMFLKQADHETV